MTGRARLRQRARQLRWYHEIDLGEGVVTAGRASREILRAQADVYFHHGIEGKSLIDVGCWDGYNSFEAHRRGARDVLATDYFAWYSQQCWGNRECIEIARALLAPEVRLDEVEVHELSVDRVGRFDIVLFAGVFYHLRNPFQVLEQVSGLAIETLILETHLDALDIDRPAMVFYPDRELAGDSTNWWGPNVPCITAMLRDVGFSEVTFTPNPSFPHNRGIFHAHR